MSEPHAHGLDPDQPSDQEPEPITEEVDALLVEAEEEVIVASRSMLPATARGMVPAVQAAAVAAGGFVAGAAVVGLVNHRHNRALAQGQPRRRLLRRSRGGRVEALQIVSTRSLLVDVHLLNNGEQG
ncbi:MAG TPA: hypothetical protein VID70_04860 [Solirubrobacteraceae bacterium]